MRWALVIVAGAVVVFVAVSLVIYYVGDRDSDDAEIFNLAQRVYTVAEADYCKRDVTEGYLEQLGGARGDAALATCKRGAAEVETRADAADVSDVVVDGDRATATVTLTGGALDGANVEVALARLDGRWRVDRVDRLTDVDRAQLTGFLARLFPPVGDPRAARCAAKRVLRFPDAELRLLLATPTLGELTRIATRCARATAPPG